MASSKNAGASPLVISLRDLGQRPGSQWQFAGVLPAPEGFGTDMIGVPVGSDLDVTLSFESVSEGVWVSGSVAGHVVGECGRCLDPVEKKISTPIHSLYLPEGHEQDPDDEEDLEDVREFDGDSIDIEGALRDAIVSLLPFQPLCSKDCAGLCPECGVRLSDNPGHVHETLDPRWAALHNLNDQAKES